MASAIIPAAEELWTKPRKPQASFSARVCFANVATARLRLARDFSKLSAPAKKIRDGDCHPLSFWQGQKDSNPRPMVLETSTLPTELYPCVHFCNAQYYIIVLSKLQAFFQKNFIFFSKKEIRFPKESNFFSVYYVMRELNRLKEITKCRRRV